MRENKINLRFGLILLIIFIAVLSRFLPVWFEELHFLYNFSPIGAIALFGAAYFSKKYMAFVIPLLIIWISDIALNNIFYAEYFEHFSLFGSLSVYLAFILIVVFGQKVLRKVKPLRILGASIGAAVLFFLITNLTAWWLNPLYPQNFSGIIESYIAGIPFFRNTLAGNLFYAALFFGVFEWITSRQRRIEMA